MDKKTKNRKNRAQLLFFIALVVAILLVTIENHQSNSLPYASNEVLASQRIKLLYIYGSLALPLFIWGLVVAARHKSLKWVLVNSVTLAVVISYVLFFVSLVSASKGFTLTIPG